MSSRNTTDEDSPERKPPSLSISTAKELVQGLMHLIMETSREMATAPVGSDDDETDIEKHADRIQDLDNRLVSQALEVWLAHDGNIDLRTFFPAQQKPSDFARRHPKAPAEPADTASSIIGNPSLFPRTNQLVYETTSLDTFYAWLSKTLPRLPPELVLLVAHTSLLDGISSTTVPNDASIPAIPSLFSYYLPHLYPYPGPCTAHIPNCRGCCTFVTDDDSEDPPPPAPSNANQPGARKAIKKQRRCITTTTSTSNPSSSPSAQPHRSPYAPLSAPALRSTWSYDHHHHHQTGLPHLAAIRAANAFAPCSTGASEPDWFGSRPVTVPPGTVYDDDAGTWRCGCQLVLMGCGTGPPARGPGEGQWKTDGKERPGKLLWNAWRRGWECGEVRAFDPGCCEEEYDDSGEEREWDEREERERERKKRAGMRWVVAGGGCCERCRRREGEGEGEEDDDMGF